MSRALRRHPQGSKRNRRGREPKAQAISPSTRPQRQREPSSSGGASSFRLTWATDIISELQKVSWPSAADTRYLTIVVLIVSATFAVFLGGVDIFFNWFIENTLLR